jgi:hypothetical protein
MYPLGLIDLAQASSPGDGNVASSGDDTTSMKTVLGIERRIPHHRRSARRHRASARRQVPFGQNIALDQGWFHPTTGNLI